MKKYVCYQDYTQKIVYSLMTILSDVKDGGYIEYEGLFSDGIYGQSWARPENIFDNEVDAQVHCNSRNNHE